MCVDKNEHTRHDRSSPLRQDDVRGPVQLGHTSFIMQRLQIRQGSLTRSRALSPSLSHAHTHTHTDADTDTHGLQYVKCEHDGNGFCPTPDCFVTDKCVTRAKGRTLSSRQNAELLRHIQNRRVQINQLPTQTALTKTPGGGARAARQTLC